MRSSGAVPSTRTSNGGGRRADATLVAHARIAGPERQQDALAGGRIAAPVLQRLPDRVARQFAARIAVSPPRTLRTPRWPGCELPGRPSTLSLPAMTPIR